MGRSIASIFVNDANDDKSECKETDEIDSWAELVFRQNDEKRNPFESKTPKGDGEPDEEAIAGARPEAQEEEATRAKNSETTATEESI
jgi:hypothetical protein